MKKYNKDKFVAADNINDYAILIGMGYKSLIKELKQEGLFQEWMDAWNERNYNDLLNDDTQLGVLNEMIDDFKSRHSVCMTVKYSYKAVARYLKEVGYTGDKTLDTNEERMEFREQLDLIMNDKFYKKRDEYYKRFKQNKSVIDKYFKEVNENLLELLLEYNIDTFTHNNIEISLIDKPTHRSVGLVKLVKAFGKDVVKEKFPELFETQLNFKIDYTKYYKKGK